MMRFIAALLAGMVSVITVDVEVIGLFFGLGLTGVDMAIRQPSGR